MRPIVGLNVAAVSQPDPKPSQIWQSLLGQSWFTSSEPLPAHKLSPSEPTLSCIRPNSAGYLGSLGLSFITTHLLGSSTPRQKGGRLSLLRSLPVCDDVMCRSMVLTCPGDPPCPAHFVCLPHLTPGQVLKTTVLHCCAKGDAGGEKGHRNCLNISRLDLIFRFFFCLNKESCAQTETTHMHKYTVYIFIYNNNKKKTPEKRALSLEEEKGQVLKPPLMSMCARDVPAFFSLFESEMTRRQLPAIQSKCRALDCPPTPNPEPRWAWFSDYDACRSVSIGKVIASLQLPLESPVATETVSGLRLALRTAHAH